MSLTNQSSQPTSDLSLSVASLLAVIGSALFPFYFITFAGVNLGPGDLLVTVAGMLYMIKSSEYLISGSYWATIGTLILIGAAAVSMIWTPLGLNGLLSVVQHGLIFLIVIPSLLLLMRSDRNRWLLYLALLCVFGSIILYSAVDIMLSSPSLGRYDAFFPKYNTYHFTLTSAIAFFSFAALDISFPRAARLTCGAFAVVALLIVVSGLTLSAILAVAGIVFIWLAVAVRRYGNSIHVISYLTLSAVAGAAGLVFIALNWSFIANQGALDSRAIMYMEAWRQGLAAFPIGTGIGSSPVALDAMPERIPRSTHNPFLHYWLELGLAGFVGFTLLIASWVRWVLISQVFETIRTNPWEISFAAAFAGYLIIAFFQPPPVRRVWWMLYAVSWTPLLRRA